MTDLTLNKKRKYRFIGVGVRENEEWLSSFDSSKRILDVKLEIQYISIELDDRTYVGAPEYDDVISLNDLFILKSNDPESECFPDYMLLTEAYPDSDEEIVIYYR